jgi:hypothetical protein
MLLVDTEQGRIIDDAELKRTLATAKPYRAWIDRTRIALEDLPAPAPPQRSKVSLLDRQQAFGYTQEDLKVILAPMALNGEEAVGSMGNDAALPVLSNRPKVLYAYFKQLFAQVTNPPIDRSARAGDVAGDIHRAAAEPARCRHRARRHRSSDATRGGKADPDRRRDGEDRHVLFTGATFRSRELDICYPAAWGAAGMEAALARPLRSRRGCHPSASTS